QQPLQPAAEHQQGRAQEQGVNLDNGSHGRFRNGARLRAANHLTVTITRHRRISSPGGREILQRGEVFIRGGSGGGFSNGAGRGRSPLFATASPPGHSRVSGNLGYPSGGKRRPPLSRG